ncbi:MAG: tetratricopeptide repeat protein [Treponema sp.]
MKRYLLFLLIPFLFSCASIPKEEKIPLDTEVIDLIQKAQEAFEINNYRGARKWYEIVLKRFGDSTAIRVEAEYEIAHILTKQRKWKEAYNLLKKVIEQYETKGGMKLPPEFYKLAKMDYEKVLKKVGNAYVQKIEMKEKEVNENENLQGVEQIEIEGIE